MPCLLLKDTNVSFHLITGTIVLNRQLLSAFVVTLFTILLLKRLWRSHTGGLLRWKEQPYLLYRFPVATWTKEWRVTRRQC